MLNYMLIKKNLALTDNYVVLFILLYHVRWCDDINLFDIETTEELDFLFCNAVEFEFIWVKVAVGICVFAFHPNVELRKCLASTAPGEMPWNYVLTK